MSSSDPDSKIDFLDTPEAVKRKIKKAFCEEGNVTENGLLAFIKAVLIPISELRSERLRGETGEDKEEGKESAGSQKPFAADDAPEGTVFTITREKGGGPSHYKTYQELEDDFAAKHIHPGDLKANVRDAIISLLEPIRAAFLANEEWQQIEQLAYPDPNAKKEPKKKKASFIISDWIAGQHVDTVSQEKVYHPPPPGKGKNAKVVPMPVDSAAVDEASGPPAGQPDGEAVPT